MAPPDAEEENPTLTTREEGRPDPGPDRSERPPEFPSCVLDPRDEGRQRDQQPRRPIRPRPDSGSGVGTSIGAQRGPTRSRLPSPGGPRATIPAAVRSTRRDAFAALSGDWRFALGPLQVMYVHFPEDPENVAHLGLANHRLGEWEAAAAAFDNALERMPARGARGVRGPELRAFAKEEAEYHPT